MLDRNRNKEENDPSQDSKKPYRPQLNATSLVFLTILLLALVLLIFSSTTLPRSEITQTFFEAQLKTGNVAELSSEGDYFFGKFKNPPEKPRKADAEAKKGADDEPEKYHELFSTFVDEHAAEDVQKLIRQSGADYAPQEQTDDTRWLIFIYLFVSILLFFAVITMFRRARDQFMGGGGILSGFSKSPAQRYEASTERVTFGDVAGLEGVKRDLQEVIDFLKNPEHFQRLGGHVPKGILLNGPPGTGKTLLARAVAGEAGVPFYSINGSEFIQMFVGVGAGRVRDLFRTAKENSPCILFIDEIDAVGRHRGTGLGGGHDEREQTLNQILSEMDGFQPNESVMVLAATNRPDVLDPALLRPGRFDRHITVDRPTQKGRVAIFRVHSKNVPLADDVDLEKLGAGTIGLTGADIRNLVNEAALWATRQGKDAVDMDDFEHARDKVIMGAKREEVLSDKEKEMTAYHEAGHALLAWLVPGNDRLHKVTIIPRGRALGVTQLLPEEDRLNICESDLRARLVFMMGGRAAEKIVYDEYSAGAENDLTQATGLARRMVAHWGMSEKIGPVAYHLTEEHPFLGREIHEQRQFSEHTQQLIDDEVAQLLHNSDATAGKVLTEHRDKLEQVARALMDREVLDEEEIEELIGPSTRFAHQGNGSPITRITTEAKHDALD